MELTLGRPSFYDHNSSFIHLHDAHEGHVTPKLGKLKAYLKSLEDERQKIEAFKRELPICMQLLCNEIEASREKICESKPGDACTFLRHSPACNIKHTISSDVDLMREEQNSVGESAIEDGIRPGARVASTPSWLRDEVNTAEAGEVMVNQLFRTKPSERSEKDPQTCSPVLGRRPGGAFVPFLKDTTRKVSFEEALVPVASPLHTPHQDIYPSTHFSASTESSTHQDIFPTAAAFWSTSSDAASHQEINEPLPPAAEKIEYNGSLTSQPTPHRKPRRCWSTDLHRRFVNALKQLGGPEATPKQIRELMQVDGLTNDEIKSHLQKYRLHTKKPTSMNLKVPATDAAQPPKGAPRLVVLGGIWVPQEYPLNQDPTDYPLKQGLGHSLYINPLPHLVNQTFVKQG